MISVRKAEPEDFERVLPLLNGFNNPALTRQHWEHLFHYTWPCATRDRGFILLDDDRFIGFIATIWSERKRGDQIDRFCNLSSWITLPEYRQHSMQLFQAILAIRDCTITCYSPPEHLHTLYRRFGFKDLESKMVVLAPIPPLGALLPFGRWRFTQKPARIENVLSPEDREIYRHHQGQACRHLLVYSGSTYCYLIFSKIRGRRAWFAKVHHLSHPNAFAANLTAMRRALLFASATPLVMIDHRLVEGLQLPGSREAGLRAGHLYRSKTRTPKEIDNLYSEVLLLGI